MLLRLLVLLYIASTLQAESLDPGVFRSPPKRFRPWVIWWWPGNASTTPDLLYELDQIDRGGFGGVHIFPTYALSGEGRVPLYSPEWTRRFSMVLRSARQRDIQVFLSGGSGWPLGGPWITKEMSSKAVARSVMDVVGPARVHPPFPDPAADKVWSVEAIEAVVAVNRDSGERVAFSEPFDWSVPAGNWRIHVFYRMLTNQMLERGSPGGEGLVLNHFRGEALDVQLAKLESLLPEIKRSGPQALAGFAADSLELEDSNWTDGFLNEFRARRGYDLTPHLPDLWERLSSRSAAIRQDFLETLSELQLQYYFGRYTDWAHRHGAKTLVQAHGAIADPLAAYGRLDIPDVETMWPGSDHQYVNLRSRRLGVSAAHIYDKPIVSAESFTWLRMPRFLVTLADIKAAADALFIDGVNQIKAHGYTSSPRRVGTPGWVFYASTMLNHNQTWWPHVPALTSYLTRVQYLMQSAGHVADVAVYHNLHDARANYERPAPDWLRDHVWRHPERDPGLDSAASIAMQLKDCTDRLQRDGYGFDVVNDEALPRVLGRYRALIFHRTEFVPAATLERALDFAQRGGLVVAVGAPPSSGVGLSGTDGNRHKFAGLVDAIWGKGLGLTIASLDALQGVLDERVSPSFRAGGPVGFIHRRLGDQDVFFVASDSDQPLPSVELDFRASGGVAERWNPMDGSVVLASGAQRKDGRIVLRTSLNPRESAVFVFGGKSNARQQSLISHQRAHAIEGSWQIRLNGRKLALGRLRDWTLDASTRNFSGIGSYRIDFDLPRQFDVRSSLTLDLGVVHTSAEVLINGKPAGIAFLQPFRVTTKGLFRTGLNKLEIRVANLWNNHVMAMPPAPSTIPAPGYGITDVLYGPSERTRQPSGLLGPVVLIQEEEKNE